MRRVEPLACRLERRIAVLARQDRHAVNCMNSCRLDVYFRRSTFLPVSRAQFRVSTNTGERNMNYLKRLQRTVEQLGGAGRFQREEYVRQNVSRKFAEMLLAAKAFGPPTEVLTDAPASGCHVNSMNYVMSNGGELWSGFALNDGIWRVHSWVVQDRDVIEATPFACERYVGIAINTPERVAASFPQAEEQAPVECSKRVSS